MAMAFRAAPFLIASGATVSDLARIVERSD